MNILSKSQIRDIITKSVYNVYAAQGIANPPTGPGSHIYAEADALSTTLAVVQNNIQADLQATSEATAIGAQLDQVASNYNLQRKPASKSIGYIQIQCQTQTQSSIYIDETYALRAQNGSIYYPTTTGYYGNNSYCQIQSQATGQTQNLPIGSILTWSKVPQGSNTTAIVATQIAGGSSSETDSQLQQRIQNSKLSVSAGSSAQLFQLSSNISPYVDSAYIYPSIQGPGSTHIAVAAPAIQSLSRSRQVSQNNVNIINQNLQSQLPQTANILVQSVIDNPLDIIFQIKSNSWIDSYPLPKISTTAYLPYIYVSSVSLVGGIQQIVFTTDTNMLGYFINNTSSGGIILNNNQYINISTIRTTDYTIQNSQITNFNQTGTGPYTITANLNVSMDLQANVSWIFPSNLQTQQYLNIVLQDFANMGAGEKLTNTTYRTQRYPTNPILNNQMSNVFNADLETTNSISTSIISYVYDLILQQGFTQANYNISPIPVSSYTSITTGPYIFKPARIAFYPLSGT